MVLSEKQLQVEVRTGLFKFFSKDGKVLIRNTQHSVIPKDWNGSLDRNDNFNKHSEYIIRALKLMHKSELIESKKNVSELTMIEKLKQIKKKFSNK